ncbi:MAG: HAMP domain-containing protein [Gemmatimonadaceae bacterium]|nr:HAMP domain-containing protein [Gemmatimonadaceae bacterium]
MPRWPTSLRWRLTVRYTILLALPLVAFALGCYMLVARTLERRTDVFITDALNAFSRELRAERRSDQGAIAAIRQTVEEVRFRALNIAIVDSSGHVIATSGRIEEPADLALERPATDLFTDTLLAQLRQQEPDVVATTVRSAGGQVRVLARPLDLGVGTGRFVLMGAYSLDEITAVIDGIRRAFLISIPVLLLIAALGSHALANRSLAPLAAMSAQASAITVRNLHERLPVTGGDELVQLATVSNGLLDRLEEAFEQQRRFVADASHELRTPTAVVKTEADVTLSRPHRDEEEYRASVTVMQDAAHRMSRIVADLFLLSRADAGHLVMKSEPLYLDEAVQDATRVLRRLAAERGVEIVVHELSEAPLVGDRDLLGRLVLNLLDNAVKYSPPGGTVDVSLTHDAAGYAIRVHDRGPGIPPESRERIFERFYRVDAARSRADASATSGAGLGLAIARRIAVMHGGAVYLEHSRPGDTQFLITLPAAGLATSG